MNGAWAPQSGSRVEGQLLNSVTQLGIGGVKVTVTSIRVVLTYETYTDSAGKFQFPLVAPGDYSIWFDVQGYLPLPVNDPATQVFHVADMTAPVRFEEQLTPLGTLSGRIFDAEDRPAANVQMEMLRARGGGVSLALSDAEGRFLVRSLMPGAYVLLARPMLPGSGGSEKQHSALPPPTAPEGELPASRLTWAATYYPGATERTGAQSIVIHPGSSLTAYDFHLRAAPLFRVRGVVLDEVGKPVAGADLTLRSAELLTEPEASAQSAGDGTFELAAVCPGDWRIWAGHERAKVMLRGSAPVSVGRRDVEGVTVRIAPPFAVEGSIESNDSLLAAPRAPITVQVTPVDGPPDRQASAAEGRDGFVHIPSVYTGRYRIEPLGSIAGYYLESVRLGALDAINQPVDLAPNSPPIRITYRSGAGHVSGVVENGWGSTVALLPKEEKLIGRPFLRIVALGPDAHFDMANLHPGDYYLWAFERVDAAALLDPDFVRNLIPLAETVHIAQGESEVTPSLHIIPWPE